MVRITNGTTQKYVTNGAYEDFYKPIGYYIIGEKQEKREVETPIIEIKEEPKQEIKEEVIEIKLNNEKVNKKSPETKEFKKR